MSVPSDYSYPSTDETSIDSSDDENFRRKLNMRRRKACNEETNTPAKHSEASFVNNVCFANGTQLPNEISFSRDMPDVSMQQPPKNDLQYYQGVIVPLLREFGWDFDPIQAKFMVPCGSSMIKIGTDALQRITKIFEGNEAVGISNNDSSARESLISQLEEEILFQRMKANISLQTVVEDSCVATPSKEELSNLLPATEVTPKNTNQSLSSTNPRKRDRDSFEGKQVKTSPPENGGISTVGNKSVEFVYCRKVLPKFTSNSLKGEEIFPLTFGTGAVKKVFEDLSKVPPPSERKRLLIARLSNDSTDPLSLILQAKGRSDLVDNLLKLVGKRVTSIQALENIRAVLNDKNSLEIDVKIDVREDLGLKTVKPFGKSEHTGIWIASTTSGGQFQNIFGTGTDKGAVLMKISKENVRKLADKNRLLAKAKSKYEESGKKGDKWTSVTVCLSRDANLQYLDHTRVIISNGRSIRYRDGTAYQGKWKLKHSTPQKQDKLSRENTSSVSSNKTTNTKFTKLGSNSQRIALHRQLSDPCLSVSDSKMKPPFVRQNSEPNLPCPELQDDNISTKKQKRTATTADDMNVRRDFTIIFNPSTENLGFYCETKKLANGKGTYCVITSVDPEGIALKKDPQTRIGTVIDASEAIGTSGEKFQKLTIHSHTDLKWKYDAVKTKDGVKPRFKLYFHYRGRKPQSPDNLCGKEWTKTGAWIMTGKEKDGWAGGTTVVRNEENKMPSDTASNVQHEAVSNRTDTGDSLFHLPKKIKTTDESAQMKNETVKFSQPTLTKVLKKLEGKSDIIKGKGKVPNPPRSSKLIFQQRENAYAGSRDKGAQSSSPEKAKVLDKPKSDNTTNNSADGMKSDASDERQRIFLQRAGISMPKSSKKVPPPSLSVHNSLGERESSSGGSNTSSAAVTSETTNYSPPQVHPNLNKEQKLVSILKKPGEKNVTRRVSFNLSVTGSRKQNSSSVGDSGRKNQRPEKVDLKNASESKSKLPPKQNSSSVGDSGRKNQRPENVDLKSVSESKSKLPPIANKQNDMDVSDKSYSDTCVHSNMRQSALSKEHTKSDTGSNSGQQQRKQCEVCQLFLQEDSYSKTQWRKPGGGKCKICVIDGFEDDSSKPPPVAYQAPVDNQQVDMKVCSSCSLLLIQEQYSKKQWRNGPARRCKKCISDGFQQNIMRRGKNDGPNSNFHHFDNRSNVNNTNGHSSDGFYQNIMRREKNDGPNSNFRHFDNRSSVSNINEHSSDGFHQNIMRRGKNDGPNSNVRHFDNRSSVNNTNEHSSDGFHQNIMRREKNDGPNSNVRHCDNRSSVNNTNEHSMSRSFIRGDYENNMLGSRRLPTNGGNVSDHEQIYKPPPLPFHGRDLPSGNPPSPPEVFNSNDPVDDIVNIVLYSSLQDLKLYLEKYQPSGSQIAPALSAVKRSNRDGSDSELKKKAIVLKIYSNVFYLLGKARDLKDCAEPNTPEYREERKMILKELHEKATWIQQFQARERARNNHTIIDGNIKMTGGFTMLHAAVILSDSIVTAKIMSIGAYPMATCNRWGSVFDLCKSLQHEANCKDDKGIETIQSKIYIDLSDYQKVIFGG